MAAPKKKASTTKAKPKRKPAAKREAKPKAAATKPARVRAKPAATKPARRVSAKKLAALAALVDDAAHSDAAIVAAVAALADADRRAVGAAWAERVAAGEAIVVGRALAMFELAALGASDAAALAPFVLPLREVGGQPDVFAHVEHAMASERAAVREAVCASWLADDRAQRLFDASQIDKLARCAIAIAEAHAGQPDAIAANLALSRLAHPGARHALMHALRHAHLDKHRELAASLYAGLAAIGAPDLVAFLVERLFEERVAYGALVAAVASAFDNFAHRRMLQTLAERSYDPGAVRAATLYADAVATRGKAGGRLVELGAALLGWPASTNDDARRLRHVLELALDAALGLRRGAEARAFFARASELPDAPYSDYHVLARNARTPVLLDERARDRLASL